MSNQQQETFWKAVEARDRAFDGVFYFGVLTTGVYCRPSCPARRPLRANVRFYASPADAEKDHLRPCRRCHPLALTGGDPATEQVRQICRYIEEHSEESLPLAVLAARAGLSRFHFQRSFKAITGVSPKEYQEAHRLRLLKTSLRTAPGVTEAIYDAGYGSSSRVYSRVDTRLGMTPLQYRRGGAGTEISYVATESPLGWLMIGATDRGICFIQFGDSPEVLLQQLEREYPKAAFRSAEKNPELSAWLNALGEYLSGSVRDLNLPLDIQASAFRMRVWKYLQSIPYGEVQSYSEVARGIGQPSAVRAVARACASNTVALAIPCHRVIRGTGEMGGYRWGLERKRTLIDRERAAARSAAVQVRG